MELSTDWQTDWLTDWTAWTGQFQSVGVVGSKPLFNVRVFNPYAPSNRSNPYCKHDCAKCRSYEERFCEIEHGSISPLLFSTSRDIDASTIVTYKHLAFLLYLKWKTPYCRVMSWLHCRLGFSLLHSAIICISGSCSSSGCPLRGHVPASIDLALEERCFGAV